MLELGLWFGQQVANGVTAVAVSVDPKNAHNPSSRAKCLGALKAAATKTPAMWPLAVPWHAMTSQKSLNYVRDTPVPSDWGFLS